MPTPPSNRDNRPLRSDFASDPDMAELVVEFVGELTSRTAAMETAFRDGQVERLRVLAHQLRGAAGGYGFPAISAAAGKLEDQIRALPDPAAARAAELAGQLDELIGLCRRATAA